MKVLASWRTLGSVTLALAVSLAWGSPLPPPLSECFPKASATDLVRAMVIEPPAAGQAAGRDYGADPQRGRLLVTMTAGEALSVELTFRMREQAAEAPYQALKYSAEQWYGSTFWTGPDWTRVGKNWHHPGERTPSVRCFRAPKDGTVTVTGRAFKLHESGDGVRLSIRQGEREIWQAEIEGTDNRGVEPQLRLKVRQGDPIRFLVHKRGNIYCDTTGWDPIVAYEGGDSFRASDSFGDKQGQDNWSYEMLTDDRSDAGRPVLRTLSHKLALAETAFVAGSPVTVSGTDVLPALILSDGAGESGVWLVVDSTGPWELSCVPSTEGVLSLRVTAAGSPVALLIGAYRGRWTAAATPLADVLAEQEGPSARAAFQKTMREAMKRANTEWAALPELDLLLMAQGEWRVEDRLAEVPERYRETCRQHLDRAEALLEEFAGTLPAEVVKERKARLASLRSAIAVEGRTLAAWHDLYVGVRLVKRDLMLRNPLLSLGPALFCKRVPTSYSHLVMQYFGWRARPGGGLFVLDTPGRSLRCRSLLGEQLPAGNVLEPRLSYDGKRVVFSFVACPATPYRPETMVRNEQGPDEGYYHVYEIGVDGRGLRQLTSGPYDDLMPEYLPDGGIVFCSTRRRGNSRCFGSQFSDRWHSYTLHRMDGDGTNLHILSQNDVSEWFPTVGHDGRLVYARWDYIDRDAVTHQNLWASRTDGTNPVALWGNATPAPHCTFQAKPVPGSRKYVAIASAHHSITAGPVCLVDPNLDITSLAAVQRVTPGPFPEAEGWDLPGYYSAPWPLSERHFLAAYCPDRLHSEGQAPNPANALGLYLLDAAGNRELLYRDPEIGSDNPTPLVSRPKPPQIASGLSAGTKDAGEFVLTDLYRGLGDVPRGSLRQLRIIQLFTKTTTVANSPRLGVAGEENGRAILGTVPIQPDGSARFTAPAGKALLFQALDENGFAYQTMRSLTYLQPGEKVSCVGCHDPRNTAPPNRRPLALSQPPSTIVAGELEGEPFSYMRTVQPVLNARCIRCHSGAEPRGKLNLSAEPDREFTRSYWSLVGDPGQFQGGDLSPARAQQALVPRFGQRNQLQVTPPGGMYGARGSRLLRMLGEGHHGVALEDSERRRLAAWIDCNAIFYGVYDVAAQARQRTGQSVPMPELQ